MTVLHEQTIEKSGYSLHIIPTDKYKTNTLIWKMKAPLQQETVTYRALLAQLLQASTKKYPTTTALRSYLDDLYGATFHVDVSKKGEYHIITFTIEVANEKFLSDSTPLLQKAVDLLREIVLQPNVTDRSFDPDIVAKEKRNLKQRLQSIYDDKMRYASVRLIEEMCKGEPYALYVHGEQDEVDTITPESLYDYYVQAIEEDALDLYVVGNINAEEIERFADKLSFKDRVPKVVSFNQVDHSEQVKEIVEKQDLKQGKLNIGCRTNIRYGDEKYFPLQLFNGIFGGFPHSKLFTNVREKANLAYYVTSRIESHKGLLMIMSGIDGKNYEQAVSIIKEQMKLMRTGQFTDLDMEQTRAVIKNQFLETIDTARGLVELLYHNVVSEQQITLDDWLQGVKQATREEVIEVAKQISLDTVYFLTGEEGESK